MQTTIINIIPGISIGDFRLAMTRKELLEVINQENLSFEISPLGSGQIIRAGDYSIWIEGDRISQISISNNQNAKIAGICGIGDTLKTWEQELNTKITHEDYITTCDEIKGLGLDPEEYPEEINTVEDFDNFDEGTLKVETIYIFPIEK
jgi:hypothetical protein